MITKKQAKEIIEILKASKNKKEIINKMALFCYKENQNLNGYRFKRACGLTDKDCGY